MSDPLATYIHDHLAGSTHAIDLLKAIRDQQGDRPLGEFAAALLPEIESDRDVLRNIADRAGLGSSAIKEAGAWLEEKVSRIKLRDLDKNGLGTFENSSNSGYMGNVPFGMRLLSSLTATNG